MKQSLLTVIRISPYEQATGKSIYVNNKFDLVRICNESFISAGPTERIYLLDNCPDNYKSYFKNFGETVKGIWGKRKSFFKACDIVKKRKEENILFLEDDYLWRENTIYDLLDGLEKFNLVSPYDHPSHYNKNGMICIPAFIVKNKTWRFCQTNTHTFALKRKIFLDNIDEFYIDQHDWQFFMKLGIKGYNLYCPMYSLATHLENNYLSYNVSWKAYINWYKKKLML